MKPEVEETQALGIWTTGATQHNPSLVRFILVRFILVRFKKKSCPKKIVP